MRAPNLGLAESALHAPAAAFDETEFYPELRRQGGSARRPTGEEPSAPRRQQACCLGGVRLFIEINDWRWDPMLSVDQAERAMLSLASAEWSESELADWLRECLNAFADD